MQFLRQPDDSEASRVSALHACGLHNNLPLLGFCAYSGSGKTTLLKALLPVLKSRGLRVAVVKHAHHQFDTDVPGKDSYEFRQAGADQVLVASKNRMAMIKELREDRPEPRLHDALHCIDTSAIDMILIEGFKHENFPKVEICRPSLRKPRLYRRDQNVIAVASDNPLDDLPENLIAINLNQTDAVADFVMHHYQRILRGNSSPHAPVLSA